MHFFVVEGAQSFKTFCLAWVLLRVPLLRISWGFWVFFFVFCLVFGVFFFLGGGEGGVDWGGLGISYGNEVWV